MFFVFFDLISFAPRRLDVRTQLQSFVRWRPDGYALDISTEEDLNVPLGDPCRGARKVPCRAGRRQNRIA